MQQRAVVQPQLRFRKRDHRTARSHGLADADIFGDESVDEVQPQACEFQFDPARVKFFDERPFQKIRQADAVEPEQRAKDGQQHEPRADAAPAEADAAFSPEAGLQTHIAKLSE